MRKLTAILRLLPLAAAALASVATSPMPVPHLVISDPHPLARETGVAVTMQPSLALSTQGGEDGEEVALPPIDALSLHRTSDGAVVAGHPVIEPASGGYVIYRFVPDADLALDDYQLVLDLGDITEFNADGLEFVDNAIVLPFSTVSRPTIHYAILANGSASAYLSFSQAMDPTTFGSIKLLDSAGVELVPTQVDYSSETFSLSLHAPPGVAHVLRIEPGLRAADGTEVAGLPLEFR